MMVLLVAQVMVIVLDFGIMEVLWMIVTFCGHKDGYWNTDVDDRLLNVIRSLINEGANVFYLGGYGNFDSLAAKAVYALKQEFPNIQSIIVLPYLDRQFNEDLYDESLYPPLEDVPLRFAISKRNEWMVEQADVIVSGVTHDWGGAYSTLKFAKGKKKRIISVVDCNL